jgi:hypothetical protein
MFNIMDSSNQYFASFFCQFIVGTGHFFLINLILAVIMKAFDDIYQKKEREKIMRTQIEAIKLRNNEINKIFKNDVIDNNLDSILYKNWFHKIWVKYIMRNTNYIPTDTENDSEGIDTLGSGHSSAVSVSPGARESRRLSRIGLKILLPQKSKKAIQILPPVENSEHSAMESGN